MVVIPVYFESWASPASDKTNDVLKPKQIRDSKAWAGLFEFDELGLLKIIFGTGLVKLESKYKRLFLLKHLSS